MMASFMVMVGALAINYIKYGSTFYQANQLLMIAAVRYCT